MSLVDILFRKPSGINELKGLLPDEILHTIYYFLYYVDYKKEFNFILIFIPPKALNHTYKRCTPCERCNVVKTYNKYCHECDIIKWYDIT